MKANKIAYPVKKPQILVVDDDRSILKLLKVILWESYEVCCKPNAVEALLWLEEGNMPDMIITDLSMPVMDGVAFIKNLKISGFYRDTPIIMLSGTKDVDQIVAEMPFEIEGHFKKPFNPSKLKDTIANILNPQPAYAVL